jgi:DNA-binding NtrC family response regulator
MKKHQPHTSARILLVDDDAATVLALSEALRDRLPDVALVTATSAESAIPLLSESCDVVICDVVMPGSNGLAVLKEARRITPSTPVILMTAGAFEKEESALYGGAYAFIEKPVDVDHLLSVIKAALERRELDQQVTERNRRSILNLRMKSIVDAFASYHPVKRS